MEQERLIGKHGGYRKLVSYQVSLLVYDVTVRFCDAYLSVKDRTHDQMIQAARSGKQNIVEGSQVSATSKKSELHLTQVARASLEELLEDYQDFLRNRDLELWDRNDPRRQRLVDARCEYAEEVSWWMVDEVKRLQLPVDQRDRAFMECAGNGGVALVSVVKQMMAKGSSVKA
ncbi:MAG: four helix bundle protein, partial [Planctomycetota bacterium]